MECISLDHKGYPIPNEGGVPFIQLGKNMWYSLPMGYNTPYSMVGVPTPWDGYLQTQLFEKQSTRPTSHTTEK